MNTPIKPPPDSEPVVTISASDETNDAAETSGVSEEAEHEAIEMTAEEVRAHLIAIGIRPAGGGETLPPNSATAAGCADAACEEAVTQTDGIDDEQELASEIDGPQLPEGLALYWIEIAFEVALSNDDDPLQEDWQRQWLYQAGCNDVLHESEDYNYEFTSSLQWRKKLKEEKARREVIWQERRGKQNTFIRFLKEHLGGIAVCDCVRELKKFETKPAATLLVVAPREREAAVKALCGGADFRLLQCREQTLKQMAVLVAASEDVRDGFEIYLEPGGTLCDFFLTKACAKDGFEADARLPS